MDDEHIKKLEIPLKLPQSDTIDSSVGLSFEDREVAAVFYRHGQVASSASIKYATHHPLDEKFIDQLLYRLGVPSLKVPVCCVQSGSWELAAESRWWVRLRHWLQNRYLHAALLPQLLHKRFNQVLFLDREICWASALFFSSSWHESAVYFMGGLQKGVRHHLWMGVENTLLPIYNLRTEHSIESLGFQLAAMAGFKGPEAVSQFLTYAQYGEPRYLRQLQELLEPQREESFRLQPSHYWQEKSAERFYAWFKKMGLEQPRLPQAPVRVQDLDLAKSFMSLVEREADHLFRHISSQLKMRTLLIGGDSPLASTVYRRALKSSYLDEVKLSPVSDLGLLGAQGAVECYHYQKLQAQRAYVSTITSEQPVPRPPEDHISCDEILISGEARRRTASQQH